MVSVLQEASADRRSAAEAAYPTMLGELHERPCIPKRGHQEDFAMLLEDRNPRSMKKSPHS